MTDMGDGSTDGESMGKVDGGDGPDALAFALLHGRLAAALVAGGFASLAAVRAAGDGALLATPGVSARGLRLIRERVG